MSIFTTNENPLYTQGELKELNELAMMALSTSPEFRAIVETAKTAAERAWLDTPQAASASFSVKWGATIRNFEKAQAPAKALKAAQDRVANTVSENEDDLQSLLNTLSPTSGRYAAIRDMLDSLKDWKSTTQHFLASIRG